MNTNFSDEVKANFLMIECIGKMFYKLTKYMKVETETPASKHLFTDNETNHTPLSNDDATMLHNNNANLLFLLK